MNDSGPGSRKGDFGVMTAFRIVTIVAGALTPFVIIVLFVARMMVQTANDDQEKQLRNVFVEKSEFNAWRSDVSQQLSDIKRNQEKSSDKLDQLLTVKRK